MHDPSNSVMWKKDRLSGFKLQQLDDCRYGSLGRCAQVICEQRASGPLDCYTTKGRQPFCLRHQQEGPPYFAQAAGGHQDKHSLSRSRT